MSGAEPIQRTGLFSRIFSLFTGQQLWSAPMGQQLTNKDSSDSGSIFGKILDKLNINGDNNTVLFNFGDKSNSDDKSSGIGDSIEINGDNNKVEINGKGTTDKTDKSDKSDKSDSSSNSKQETISKIVELIGKLIGKMNFNN